MTWLAGNGGGENARRSLRGGRRRVAVVGAVLLAVLGAGGVLAGSANAAGPTNHVFLSYHGMPSYTWTITLFNRDGQQVGKGTQTCIGGCKKSFSWDPDKYWYANFRVNSGTDNQVWQFMSTTSSRHDHCVRVTAVGQVLYTGDETDGCNGD